MAAARTRSDPERKLFVLSASWCPYCATTCGFLRENGVRFTEHDVERTEEGQRMHAALGGGGVPTLLVDGVPIRGLDFEAWAVALPPERLARPRRVGNTGHTGFMGIGIGGGLPFRLPERRTLGEVQKVTAPGRPVQRSHPPVAWSGIASAPRLTHAATALASGW